MPFLSVLFQAVVNSTLERFFVWVRYEKPLSYQLCLNMANSNCFLKIVFCQWLLYFACQNHGKVH